MTEVSEGHSSFSAESRGALFKSFSFLVEWLSEGIQLLHVIIVMKTETEGLPAPQVRTPQRKALPCID